MSSLRQGTSVHVKASAGLLRDDFRSCLTLKIDPVITGHIGCLCLQFVAHRGRDRNLWVLNGRVADKPCVRCVRLAFAQGTRFTTYADVTRFFHFENTRRAVPCRTVRLIALRSWGSGDIAGTSAAVRALLLICQSSQRIDKSWR